MFDKEGNPAKELSLSIGDMDENEWKELKFEIFVSKRYTGNTLPITVKIEEEREEFSKEFTVNFPMRERVIKPTEIVIKGKEIKEKSLPPPTLTSDVDKNIPVKPVKNPDAVAVIIGVRDYEKEDVPPVKYALNDARTVKEYLVKVLGFKEENIIYEENPTKGDLERIFGTKDNPEGELYRWVKPGKSDVFIYYAGHGAPDISSRKAYFVPSDCRPNYVKLNGYPLDVFYRNLSKIPARRIIVVIDACFSGLSEGGMLIASASPLIPVVVKNVAPQNAVIFTASKGDEVASWYDEQGHSLFTYYFLKGLRGEADLNKDGKLTCGELYDYVKENVSYYARRYLGRNQTPTFTGNEIMRLW